MAASRGSAAGLSLNSAKVSFAGDDGALQAKAPKARRPGQGPPQALPQEKKDTLRTAVGLPLFSAAPGGTVAPVEKKDTWAMTMAFEMLISPDAEELDRPQAREWLRCAGWCLPEDDLDALLDSGAHQHHGVRLGYERKANSWALHQLLALLAAEAESERGRQNAAVEDVATHLRVFGDEGGRIDSERLRRMLRRDKANNRAAMTEEELDYVLTTLGVGDLEAVDCDGLAERVLKRVIQPCPWQSAPSSG